MKNNELKNIKKLGVANFHTYPFAELIPKGNGIILKGNNGAGKTVLMTSLYPHIFTMDLSRSLNFDRSADRKPKDFIKNPSYFFAVIESDGVPLTIVLAYHKKKEGDFEKEAFVYEGDNIQFFENDQIIPLNIFKKKYAAQQIHYTKNTARTYQKWIAENIFGISYTKFLSKLRIESKIASPSIINNDKKYRIDELINEIKKCCLSFKDIPETDEALNQYSDNMKLYVEEEHVLKGKLSLLNTLSEARKKQSDKNSENVKKIEDIQRKMNGDLNKLESDLEQSELSLNRMQADKEDLEAQKQTKQSEKEELEKRQEEINQYFRTHNIEGILDQKKNTLQQIEKQINQNNNDLSRIDKEIQDNTSKQSSYSNEIAQITQGLKSLVEPPTPPFKEEDWASIEQEAREKEANRKNLNDAEIRLREKDKAIRDKTSEINDVETKLKNVKEEYNENCKDFLSRFKKPKMENETLSDYRERMLEDFVNADNKTKIKIEENEKAIIEIDQQLKELEEKPIQTNFIANNAQPLFELVDFKGNISQDEKERIEALLKEAGLLELLVTAEDVEKGVYL